MLNILRVCLSKVNLNRAASNLAEDRRSKDSTTRKTFVGGREGKQGSWLLQGYFASGDGRLSVRPVLIWGSQLTGLRSLSGRVHTVVRCRFADRGLSTSDFVSACCNSKRVLTPVLLAAWRSRPC